MLSIFDKISILHNINKNKNNIQYRYIHDIDTSLHELKIDKDFHISIQMDNQSCLSTNVFCLEYIQQNIYGAHSYKIKPCEQSFFDKIFIARMYDKMLNYYVAKNGLPNNNRSR